LKRELNGCLIIDDRKFFKFKFKDQLVETKADTMEAALNNLTRYFNCKKEDLKEAA
jgi:hypothetical protein